MFKVNLQNPIQELKIAKKRRLKGQEEVVNDLYILFLKELIKHLGSEWDRIDRKTKEIIARETEVENKTKWIQDQFKVLTRVKKEINGRQRSERSK